MGSFGVWFFGYFLILGNSFRRFGVVILDVIICVLLVIGFELYWLFCRRRRWEVRKKGMDLAGGLG